MLRVRRRRHRSDDLEVGENRAPAFERAIGQQTARTRNACGGLFSGAARGRFPSRNKIARLRHPPLCSGPPLRCGCKSEPPAGFRRHEGREGRGRTDGASR